MHAKLTLLLRGNENYGNQLTEFIDNAMQHGGERRKLIESEYADYLTMLNICKVEIYCMVLFEDLFNPLNVFSISH